MRQVIAPRAVSIATALALGSLGCASHKAAPTAVTPLSPAEAKAFDRGVDFVATLEGLDGRWRSDWDQDLQVRIGSAQLIAAVTISTTRTDSDPSQRVTYRLVAHVERELVGRDEDKEIELPSTPDDPGYTTVQDNLQRISDDKGVQYLVYLKDGADGPAWHLSPASPAVLTETESQITLLHRDPKQNSGEQVIVHNN
ncbi:MAG: hypothetical protein JWN48_4003 [Myxococcaceae bacterium]|nr:hypothetical protein [Myxococcaceae bacterium]